MKNIQQNTIVKLTPEYIPILCPRCNGYKSLSYGRIPCDMCEQLGFLKVPVKEGKEVHSFT